MCRLSIIVPFLGDTERFEDTLASVLQNRPGDCEVLVVHRGPYDDPYGLEGEVHFIQIPVDAQLIEAVNAGFSAARGEVVHVLRVGVLAKEDWAEPALERFDDPLIGAVSPLVLKASHESRILSAGLRYTFGGRRLLNGLGKNLKRARRVLRRSTIGPSLTAGFYRRSVIEALGGLCPAAGSRFSDVDVALCLKALEYRSVVEPASVLVGDDADDVTIECFRSGRRAERIFWRHAGTNGWLRSLFFHPFTIARLLLASWKCPGVYASLLGRTVGMIQTPFCHSKDRARIERAAESLEGDSWSRSMLEDRDEYADDVGKSTAYPKGPRRRAA